MTPRDLARRLTALEAAPPPFAPPAEVDEREVLAEVADYQGRSPERDAWWAAYRARGADALPAEVAVLFHTVRGCWAAGLRFDCVDCLL